MALEEDVQSDYHDITKPAFQKAIWDEDYYQFVDDVDSNLKLSGTVSNRPSSANAPDDAWYEATDQNLIYRNDSSNGWVVIGHGDENNPVPEGNYETLNTGQAQVTGQSDITVNVPTDADDLQTAAELAARYLSNSESLVVINIETGHTIGTGLTLTDGDYSNIILQSEDATVPVSSGVASNIIQGVRATLPVLDCVLDAGGNGESGVFADEDSAIYVTEGSGVTNAGGRGLYLQGSRAYAFNTVWTGATGEPFRASSASRAMVQDSDFTGGGNSFYVSRSSTVNGAGIDVGSQDILVRRSLVNIQECTCGGISAQESGIVSAAASTINGDVRPRYGSHINIYQATVDATGVQDAIRVSEGSTAMARGATVSAASRYGAFAESGSRMDVSDVPFTGIGESQVVVLADGGNWVNADGATVGGAAITASETNVSALNSPETDGIVFG
jgi:hypothetical protein